MPDDKKQPQPVPVTIVSKGSPITVRVQYAVAIIAAIIAGYAAVKAQDTSSGAQDKAAAAQHSALIARQAVKGAKLAAANATTQAAAAQAAAQSVTGLANLAKNTAARVATDEHQTCEIQRRGLPAARLQAYVNRDLGLLLAHVPRRPHPTTLERHDRKLLLNLRHDAWRYFQITRHQPKTRKC